MRFSTTNDTYAHPCTVVLKIFLFFSITQVFLSVSHKTYSIVLNSSCIACFVPNTFTINKKNHNTHIVFFSHSGASIQGIDHGVPDSWSKIKTWLDQLQLTFTAHPLPEPSFLLKCPEITELDRYDISPTHSFWNNFPKNTSIL